MMDKNRQRQVWQRIYGQSIPEKPSYSRQALLQALRREEMNFRYYDSLRWESVYGPAFGRLADDAMEHTKMLKQILGR